MAKIIKDPRRKGMLLLTYYDVFGKRHRPSFPDTPEGRRAADLEKAIVESQAKRTSAVPHDITVSKYIPVCDAVWTAEARKGIRAPGTPLRYNTILVLHVEPYLGRFKVRAVSRQMVEQLLTDKGQDYSHAHVGNILAATSALLTQAQDHGIISINPLFRMGKAVRGHDRPMWRRQVKTRAMEREERDRFLDAALLYEPKWYPAFATLVYAGLRMGELRGLQRDDIRRIEIRVERQIRDKENPIHPGRLVAPPKGSKPGRVKSRSVDLADQLVPILHRLVTRPGPSRWLFFETTGEPTLKDVEHFTDCLGRAMKRVLEKAGLWKAGAQAGEPEPEQFTPHDLRHTFACAVITQDKVQTGDLLLYLSQQLGHDTTAETEKTYAHWLKQRNRAAVTAAGERAEEHVADVPLSSVILPFKAK